ncbi:nuclear transport factor 2 family protein [Flavobacterium sp. 5]|uniref:nuclear transport factor 2 family protein n=1 Tax=Flavobacterium sp. 5 TaxID=2035199 RepID=UPI000C2C5FA9|nr:nuclear transport factor 2 family protein [Flavobacterium sp. 5]PKB17204.1 SnoaL-like protein [Flavobacterium sp. 5]
MKKIWSFALTLFLFNLAFSQTKSNGLNVLEKENIAVVAKYYECLFKTRDFKTMVTLIADKAVYNQAEGLAYGGVYIGFGEWITMFTKAGTYYDLVIEKEPTYFTNDSKDEVIILFTIKCKSKKSGEIISMPISEHFELQSGKITAIRPFYFDTKAFANFLN